MTPSPRPAVWLNREKGKPSVPSSLRRKSPPRPKSPSSASPRNSSAANLYGLWLFSALSHAFVTYPDQSLRIRLVLQQSEVSLRKPRRKCRNAFSDERRHNPPIQLVHQVVL